MDQFSERVGFIKRSCVFFQPMGYVKVHVVAIELDEDFLSWHLFQLSTSQVLQVRRRHLNQLFTEVQQLVARKEVEGVVDRRTLQADMSPKILHRSHLTLRHVGAISYERCKRLFVPEHLQHLFGKVPSWLRST